MRYLVLLFFLCCTIACKDNLDGTCDRPFVITVDSPIPEDDWSVYNVKVKKAEKWWVSNIILNGVYIRDIVEKHLSDTSFVYKNESFVFEKINASDLKISVKNQESIKLQVMLQWGNCFGSFEIQK